MARRWHAALAYAVLGAVPAGLDEPGSGRPELARLVDDLAGTDPGGIRGVRRRVETARRSGPWPFRVPTELARDLGPAQFAAALTELRRSLGVDATSAPVITDRPLTAAERRLAGEVPPHHGS